MKNNFEILEAQLELDMGEQGKIYKIFLKSTTDKYDKIGIQLDGKEYYNNTCWFTLVFIEFDKSISQQKLCYVDFDGNISEVEDIDNDFLEEILKTIKY